MPNLFAPALYNVIPTHYILPRDWLDAHQLQALSLSMQLNGRPLFSDLMSKNDGTTDGTWQAVGNVTGAGQAAEGGAMACGAFTEFCNIIPNNLNASVQSCIRSMRTSQWYVAMRSGIVGGLCTNAGSRQALVSLSNNLSVYATFGFAPALHATNYCLWIETANVVNSFVVSGIPAAIEYPRTDYGLYFDGVSIIAKIGDPLNGTAMNDVAELQHVESLNDFPSHWDANVRIVVEAGGPTVAYEKAMCIGITNR